MGDHYRTLGLPRDASKADVKNAFFRLAHRHDHLLHADAAARAGAARLFREAKDAYEVLSDDRRRAEYDLRLRRSSSSSSSNSNHQGNRHGGDTTSSSSSSSSDHHGNRHGGGSSSSSSSSDHGNRHGYGGGSRGRPPPPPRGRGIEGVLNWLFWIVISVGINGAENREDTEARQSAERMKTMWRMPIPQYQSSTSSTPVNKEHLLLCSFPPINLDMSSPWFHQFSQYISFNTNLHLSYTIK